MFWIFVSTLVLVLLVAHFIDAYKFNKKLERFASPPANIVLGHSLYLLNPPAGILLRFYDLVCQYGESIVIRIGLDRTVLITAEYKLIEFLLSHAEILKKGEEYDFLKRWLGTGLLINKGDLKWKKHRKILTPAFHFKILEEYVKVFYSAGEILVEKLEEQVNKESVNICPFISLYTLDIVCETAMNTSVNAQKGEHSDYVKSVKEMCRIIVDRAVSICKQKELFYKFSLDYQIERKCLKILHNYSNNVIKTSLEKADFTEEISADDVGLKTKKSFLDILLSKMKSESLTLEDIRQEVDTFMFAGHDTTATAINFVIYNLAHYPDIQEKVFQEQKEIFKDDLNRELNGQDIRDMKYLELVIKETLRMYPSVPFYSRQLQKDVIYDGEILPKDLIIVMFPFALHRNPKYFPNPDKFDPSRFEQIQGQYPYSFISFSSGPRNCIGQKFAMFLIKSTISQLIRKFHFLPTDPPTSLQLEARTVLISKNGVNVRIKMR